MKPVKQMASCEHCNALIEIDEPPLKEQYESSLILINNGYVLLPERLVKVNHIEGKPDCRAFLDGYYCGPKCLFDRMKEILHDDD